MDENGNPITPTEPVEPSTDNISAAEGGETVTPEEIAETLHLKPINGEQEDEPEPTPPEEEETPPETPPEETPETSLKEEKPQPTPPEDVEPPVFSLEVEDVNGEKLTIGPDDDVEKVFENFEPKSNGQIFKILDDLQKLRADKESYESEEAEKAENTERETQLVAIRDGWDKEIKELQGSKRIPVVNEGEENKRVDEVFEFMNEENQKRIEQDKPLIRSFEDALDKLELREQKQAEEQRKKEQKETARKKGALVGGSSAPVPTGGVPAYTGGARTASQAAKMMGLL